MNSSGYSDINSTEKVPEQQLICPKILYLNKSKSKYVASGLSADFRIIIRVGGLKQHQSIDFDLDGFQTFLQFRNFMEEGIEKKNYVDFKFLKQCKLFVKDVNNISVLGLKNDYSEVYFAKETLLELFASANLIIEYCEFLAYHEFPEFYRAIVCSASKTNGDLIQNIHSLLDDSYKNMFNTLIMKEYIKYFPRNIIKDICYY